jgi:hypothetical protein
MTRDLGAHARPAWVPALRSGRDDGEGGLSDRPLHGLILRSRPAWDCVSKDEASAAPVSDLSGTLVVRDAMRSRMAPHDEGVVLADRGGSWVGWRTRKPPRSRGFRPGCAADEDGGRGAPGRRCFSKRWVTTRRSSLGDFGHSRLALRREGSDRHRGCYPTDPTGEGCPSFRRDRFPPSLRAEFSCPGGRCSIRPRRAGLPLSAGADENPPPARPRGFHPPTYAPRHPQRVHGGTPFSVAP